MTLWGHETNTYETRDHYERIRGFACMRYINPRLIDWLIDYLMRLRPRPRPITVEPRPRPIPRPKKWYRDHAGLETLTSLLQPKRRGSLESTPESRRRSTYFEYIQEQIRQFEEWDTIKLLGASQVRHPTSTSRQSVVKEQSIESKVTLQHAATLSLSYRDGSIFRKYRDNVADIDVVAIVSDRIRIGALDIVFADISISNRWQLKYR